MAEETMNAAQISEFLRKASLQSSSDLNDYERSELLDACDKLRARIETPQDSILRIMFAVTSPSTCQATAVRIAVDMNLFDFAAKSTANELKVDEMATSLNVDPLLLNRIMRMLAAMGFFEAKADENYITQSLAKSLVDGSPLASMVTYLGSHTEIMARLPEYLERTSYRTPDDAFNGPFQHAMKTDKTCYEWLKGEPKLSKALGELLSIYRQGKGEEWYDFYPVERRLSIAAADPSRPCIVDMGGGIGHDIHAFRSRYPDLPGRFILQDLPNVIAHVPPEFLTTTTTTPSADGNSSSSGNGSDGVVTIEAMHHDFFTPQPIRGAKAYYFRTVLHNWPDKQVLTILGHVRDAMSKDSILLVNENLESSGGRVGKEGEESERKGDGGGKEMKKKYKPTLLPASEDLTMMALFAAMNRTEEGYRDVIERAGFEVVGVWRPGVEVPGFGTLFEALPRGL